MSDPAEALDHVYINTGERLDDLAATYRRMGFQLTPRGIHTLGTRNHTMVFGRTYLELVGIPEGLSTPMIEHLRATPRGLAGIALASDDIPAACRRMSARGVGTGASGRFSRPVDTPDGSADAAFETASIADVPGGPSGLFFCRHLTPELIWRDEWRNHPNGALEIVGMDLAGDDVATMHGWALRMLGGAGTEPVAMDCARLPPARIGLMSPEALQARDGMVAESGGRRVFAAALTIGCRDLDQAGDRLAAGDIEVIERGAALVVPAHVAGNCTLRFVAMERPNGRF